MKDKGEKGSFTVEAILSLSIFMFAFVTIVSLATVAKIESTTQYAIDQAAKEISKYTYIASRANLLVHPKDSAEATVDSIDEAVQSMYDFSDVLSSSTGGNGVPLNSEGLSDMLSGMSGDDFKSITASAQNVYNSFAPLMSDPKGAITALAQVVAQKGGSALVAGSSPSRCARRSCPSTSPSRMTLRRCWRKWAWSTDWTDWTSACPHS